MLGRLLKSFHIYSQLGWQHTSCCLGCICAADELGGLDLATSLHGMSCRLDPTLIRFDDDEAARHAAIDLLVSCVRADKRTATSVKWSSVVFIALTSAPWPKADCLTRAVQNLKGLLPVYFCFPRATCLYWRSRAGAGCRGATLWRINRLMLCRRRLCCGWHRQWHSFPLLQFEHPPTR